MLLKYFKLDTRLKSEVSSFQGQLQAFRTDKTVYVALNSGVSLYRVPL